MTEDEALFVYYLGMGDNDKANVFGQNITNPYLADNLQLILLTKDNWQFKDFMYMDSLETDLIIEIISKYAEGENFKNRPKKQPKK